MAADFTAKQGDTNVVFAYTIVDATGTAVSLTGATVKFVMRALTASDVTTNLAATIVSPSAGTVSYTPTAADTKNAGLFAANWLVTFSGGLVETFPVVGYMTVEIQENLTTPGGASIVALGDVKDYLNIPAADRTHDGELLRFIDGATPVIENIVGPVVQRVYQNEAYRGGMTQIALRHTPVVEVTDVAEFRGPIRWPLTQVATPDLGSIYTYMFEPPGYITRRGPAGSQLAFPPGEDTVLVTYTAGYAQVPSDIRLGTLELLRVNYQDTQQAGRRPFGQSPDDNEPTLAPLGFFVPGRVRELLANSRRYPSLS